MQINTSSVLHSHSNLNTYFEHLQVGPVAGLELVVENDMLLFVCLFVCFLFSFKDCVFRHLHSELPLVRQTTQQKFTLISSLSRLLVRLFGQFSASGKQLWKLKCRQSLWTPYHINSLLTDAAYLSILQQSILKLSISCFFYIHSYKLVWSIFVLLNPASCRSFSLFFFVV